MPHKLNARGKPICQRYVYIPWRFADSCGRPFSKQIGEATPELFNDMRLDLCRLQLSDGVDRLLTVREIEREHVVQLCESHRIG
jgi:hypothetical protein